MVIEESRFEDIIQGVWFWELAYKLICGKQWSMSVVFAK